MRVEKSGENGCWQHETLDPSTLSELSAAAYFIWKSMQQNAVNCQTSDFGSYCYTQNSEIPRVLAVTLAWEQKGGINRVRNKALVWLELRNTQDDFWYMP